MRPSKEPVLYAFGSTITALIAVLVSFGVDLTGEQQAAIAGLIVAVAALSVAVRNKVTPRR